LKLRRPVSLGKTSKPEVSSEKSEMNTESPNYQSKGAENNSTDKDLMKSINHNLKIEQQEANNI
jgi:hypothetical protein